MKRIILTIAFLITTSAQVCPQWFWQNPLPQSNGILDSYFIDDLVGWAVGNYGACIKTTDGGETWQHIQLPINSNLSSVHFINDDIGFIGSWDGELLKTTDGGKNWSVNNIDEYADIYVYFINQNYGWLLSSTSPTSTYKVYKTTDGGNSWQSNFITPRSMHDIYFLDTSKGFLVGGFGEIYMSTNGGVDWKLINSPTSEFLYKVKFKNPLEGFILGRFGTLLHTTDGGYNWTNKSIGQNTWWDIDFIDENKGIIVGNRFRILVTFDGGNSWLEKTFSSVWALTACNYLDETKCIVFGEKGNIYKSSDSGNNWESKVLGDRNDISDLTFIKKIGFAVGKYGTILKTTNKGISWNKLNQFTNEHLNSVCFIDSLNGWIVGSNSLILRTFNGGEDWEIDSISDDMDLTTVIFLNNHIGWIAGNSDKILKTTDGGANWISYSVNIQHININSIFMVNDSLGFACGYYGFPPTGYIIKSTNGGLDWDVVKNDNSSFNSVFFTNPLNGWVVGRSDKTLHTTNGGIDWTEIYVGGKDIYFSNNLNGIIVNYYTLGSDIFITKDGGNNWTSQPRVTDRYLYSAFADSDGFWGAGMSGTILYSNDPLITGMEDLLNIETNVNDYTLSQNYPNPFNPSTKISWQSPVGSWQTLKVYDILGNEVETLVNGYKDAGYQEVQFNAAGLSSGVYFYRIQAGEYVETKKMVLLR